jgi:putative ABC transport system permease protein
MAEIAATVTSASTAMTALLGAIAAVSLLVGGIGITNIMLVSVTERTQEIGIRLAIGADRKQVLGMVLGQGLALSGAGIVVGLLGAFALTRMMQGLLYNVEPDDPLTFTAVAAGLLVIALLAALLPAWRATRVSPTTALREG